MKCKFVIRFLLKWLDTSDNAFLFFFSYFLFFGGFLIPAAISSLNGIKAYQHDRDVAFFVIYNRQMNVENNILLYGFFFLKYICNQKQNKKRSERNGCE